MKLTEKELLAAVEIEIKDLNRLLNETAEQAANRVAFFGDETPANKTDIASNRVKYLNDLIRNNNA